MLFDPRTFLKNSVSETFYYYFLLLLSQREHQIKFEKQISRWNANFVPRIKKRYPTENQMARILLLILIYIVFLLNIFSWLSLPRCKFIPILRFYYFSENILSLKSYYQLKWVRYLFPKSHCCLRVAELNNKNIYVLQFWASLCYKFWAN